MEYDSRQSLTLKKWLASVSDKKRRPENPEPVPVLQRTFAMGQSEIEL